MVESLNPYDEWGVVVKHAPQESQTMTEEINIGFFGLCIECKDDEYKLEGYNLEAGFVCEDCYKKQKGDNNNA